jgi:hypothetical protein
MSAYLKPLCQLAPFVALGLLGILGVIDTTTMIILVVILTTMWGGRGACSPRARA